MGVVVGETVFLRVAFEGERSSKTLDSGATTWKSLEESDLFGDEPLELAGLESEVTLTTRA